MVRVARVVPHPFSRLLASTPTALHRFSGHSGHVLTIAAHPTLPYLVSGAVDGSVLVSDVEDPARSRALGDHGGFVWSVAMDAVGSRLASGSKDKTVRVWDLRSGHCLSTLTGHEDQVMAVTWNAAGSHIASGAIDGTVHVWNPEEWSRTQRPCWSAKEHTEGVSALASHPTDDLFASGSEDRTVRIWSWTSDKCVRVLGGHSDAVKALAASATHLVSGSKDKCVRVWSWTTGECVRIIVDSFQHHLSLNSMAWRDSMLVTVEVVSGTVSVWDAASSDPREWERVGVLPETASSAHGVAILSGGRIAFTANSEKTGIVVWGR